jgi:hypothetical protein
MHRFTDVPEEWMLGDNHPAVAAEGRKVFPCSAPLG